MKGTHKRGCELIQGHYSPVSLPVGRLELLALGYILLDFINRYLRATKGFEDLDNELKALEE